MLFLTDYSPESSITQKKNFVAALVMMLKQKKLRLLLDSSFTDQHDCFSDPKVESQPRTETAFTAASVEKPVESELRDCDAFTDTTCLHNFIVLIFRHCLHPHLSLILLVQNYDACLTLMMQKFNKTLENMWN